MFILSGGSAATICLYVSSAIIPVCCVVLSIIMILMYFKRKQDVEQRQKPLTPTGKFPTAMIICSVVVPLVYLGFQIGVLISAMSGSSAVGGKYPSDFAITAFVLFHFLYAIMLTAIFLLLRIIYAYKNPRGGK